jgi:hypothetical protein
LGISILENSPGQEPHHQRASQRCPKRHSPQEFLALVGANMSTQHAKKVVFEILILIQDISYMVKFICNEFKESIADKPETPNAVAPLISTRLQRSAGRHVMQWLTPDLSLNFQ